MNELLDNHIWLLPIIIFFGRILDVSLGTLRIVFISKGARHIAPAIGFIEVFLWIAIIAQIFNRTNGMLTYLAYAAGYAMGTYIGLTLENKIGFGFVICRLFTKRPGVNLVADLNKANCGATIIKGRGAVAEINIVEVVTRRVIVGKVEKMFQAYDAGAFYTIEDVRTKRKGIFAKYL